MPRTYFDIRNSENPSELEREAFPDNVPGFFNALDEEKARGISSKDLKRKILKTIHVANLKKNTANPDRLKSVILDVLSQRQKDKGRNYDSRFMKAFKATPYGEDPGFYDHPEHFPRYGQREINLTPLADQSLNSTYPAGVYNIKRHPAYLSDPHNGLVRRTVNAYIESGGPQKAQHLLHDAMANKAEDAIMPHLHDALNAVQLYKPDFGKTASEIMKPYLAELTKRRELPEFVRGKTSTETVQPFLEKATHSEQLFHPEYGEKNVAVVKAVCR